MSLPDISFENIRPLDGNRHGGFEELCCQLAAREAEAAGEAFYRKGRGADAGVECYCQHADGTETGWQAKYLWRWDDSLTRQLDDSIKTALEKHPQLVEYVVCLPFDLPDSRTGRGKSARQKWDAWCVKWKKRAATQKRNLIITLWGKNELCTRLIDQDPGYLLYWFDHEVVTAGWFMEQFEKARDSLGSRYMPETNVALPIRQDFLAFARHPELQQQIDAWVSRIIKHGQSAIGAIDGMGADESDTYSESLAQAVPSLTSLLEEAPIEPHQLYPLDKWGTEASHCLDLAGKALYWVYTLSGTVDSASRGLAQQRLHGLMEVLKEIREALASNRWRLANEKAVLLQGSAGIGKSHLLADIVEHHLHEGGPAVLVLGDTFVDGEPGRQILTHLDRPPTEQFKHFLGSLDAAAQVVGMRALVCIDALNERNGLNVWPHRLTPFLKMFEAFPRVGVILSCRSTYVPHVIPENLGKDQLFRVDHHGFAADGGKAAQVYLDKRGVVRPGAPQLVPEFENPLFLKTCCDFLEKEGKTELPKGLRGVTSIFTFYNRAITRSLTQRMHLDPHLDIVPKAIAQFAQLLVEASTGYARKDAAIPVFESVLPSGGSLEKSLLSQLESEGLLTVEPVPQHDGSLVEMVRFTFERFSDHAIATRLLDDHLDTDDVADSFEGGKPLGAYIFGPENHAHAGIIEAIAVQLPERTTVEIMDVGAEAPSVVRHAFLESLLWREQTYFTDRTFALARSMLQPQALNDLLISISTEPTNKFNARFVHTRLIGMKMPECDTCWSVPLAERGFNGPVEALISWAIENGQESIDEERTYLAATMLTWFLTTSHREIRDKATKALACVLSRRLRLAARVLDDFAGVNDPYVLERLLAACYGAVLQGTEEPGLSVLAQGVFDTIFADGHPQANALLRDHARGIVEYAAWRGVLDGSIDLTLVRPPYHSPWPIEPVPDTLIERYTEDRGRGSWRIVSSTVHDGDFARYQVADKVNKWSPAKIGTTPLPTSHDLYRAWTQEFSAQATAAQRRALQAYINAAEDAKDVHGDQSTPETEQLAAAGRVLQHTMSSDQWEDFRVRAQGFIRYRLFAEKARDWAATFNTQWALRWICKRVHELGWTSMRFGHFDDSLSGSPYDHRIERIGKKYQWLALQELIARMADNLAYLDDPWAGDDSELPVYPGARLVGLRDIDPSLLIMKTHDDGWQEWSKTWWVPFNPRLRALEPHERLAWLESDNDIINDTTLIAVRDPKTQRRWLALRGFSKWTGSGVDDGGEERQRETWFRLTCLVVHRKDHERTVSSLQGRILTAPDSLPEIDLPGDLYLGEYPWHPEVRDFERRNADDDGRAAGMHIRATVARYICEGGNYDYSVDRTVRVDIPAPWLAEKMGLRLTSGHSPLYVNVEGQNLFYDPSVVEAGPAAALVDHDAFLAMLKQQDLSAIWVIAGAKSVYSGRDGRMGFGGHFRHTAIYHLDGTDLVRHYHTDRVRPSESQLEEFFGEKNR